MDDSEYYKLMNRTSRAVIMPAIKKSSEKLKKGNVDSGEQRGLATGAKSNAVTGSDSNTVSKANPAISSSLATSSVTSFSFTSLELRQGRADAEMLMEKNPRSQK